MRKTLQTHWPGIVVLITALAIGIDIYQDFGISIDEESQREIGLAAYRYAIGEFDGYTEFQFRDHGPGMEWIYIFFEKNLNLTTFRDIFLMRHLVTYLFFALSGWAMYIWLFRVFANRWLAAFGMAAVLFNPILFGHAFFNPKDVPAMSIFMISLAVAQWAFAKKKWWAFLILGLVCGYSTVFRLLNIIVLAPVAVFLLIDLVRAIRTRTGPAVVFANGLLVCAGTFIAMYAAWPALWEDPIAGFQYVYETSASYPWDGHMLLGGMLLHSLNLPWSYIPTWFAITTPELFLITGIIGMAMLIARVIDEPSVYYFNTPYRSVLMAFICFILPIIIVITQEAVLYDSWRHMYFIYPGFVVVMIFGFNELLKRRNKLVLWSLCVLQFVLIGRFMVKSHPFEHVYFNSLVSHEEDYLMKNYELDYWGTGHKQGLEWLAQYDKRYGIKILSEFWTIRVNHMFLDEHMHEHFILTDDKYEAEYYLDFFRTHPYKFPNPDFPNSKIIYENRVLGSPVYRIVKLR